MNELLEKLLEFDPNDNEVEELVMIINMGLAEFHTGPTKRLKQSLYNFTEKLMGSKSFGQIEFEAITPDTTGKDE